MEAKASLSRIRQTPRKLMLVADLIRNQKVGIAISQLNASQKRGAVVMKKLLHSAIANAVNNYALDASNLVVKKVLVNPGPTYKRVRPRAHGRAYQILKRTSHIVIVVSDNNNN